MGQLLSRGSTAQGAILRNRFVKFGTANATAVQAAAATDLIYGINAELDVDDGERHDVVVVGVADLVAGAAFARGSRLTSDAQGRGVVATTGNQIGAVALESALAAGDRVRVLVTPGTV